MNKELTAGGVGTIGLLLLLTGCASSEPALGSLESGLEVSGNTATLTISEAVTVEADSGEFVLACPYATVDSLDGAFGDGWESNSDAKRLPGLDEGEYSLLALVGGEVEVIGVYPRSPIDLCAASGDATTGAVFQSSEALQLTREADIWRLST